jgi:hypothetical protein
LIQINGGTGFPLQGCGRGDRCGELKAVQFLEQARSGKDHT